MGYFLLLVAVVAVILSAGCATIFPGQPPGPATTEVNFGSAYSDSGQAITVYSAQKTKNFTSVLFNVPSAKEAAGGNTFVIVEAQIENTGAERITFFPHYFSIRDSDGNRFEKVAYHGEGGLMAGDLEKNQYKRGKLLFEIPDTAKDLVLYYDFNGRLLSWKIA